MTFLEIAVAHAAQQRGLSGMYKPVQSTVTRAEPRFPSYIKTVKDPDRLAALLYDGYSSMVMRIAAKYALFDEAEHIVNDAILNATMAIGSYNPRKARFSTWIGGIASNRCKDELRKRKRRAGHKRYSLEKTLEDDSDLTLGDRVQYEQDLTHDVGNDYLANFLKDALDCLPVEQREVISLKYFEEKTQSEISEHLDVPLGTVKTRMRLAMKKLKAYVTEHSDRLDGFV